MLIKLKKIFEYFSCFWKVFCFENFHKNPKIFNSAFWRLTCKSRVFKAPVATLLRMASDSLESKSSSHKKHLENFSKSGFCTFLVTHSRVTSSSKSVRDSLLSGSSSHKKDLEKFFKI